MMPMMITCIGCNLRRCPKGRASEKNSRRTYFSQQEGLKVIIDVPSLITASTSKKWLRFGMRDLERRVSRDRYDGATSCSQCMQIAESQVFFRAVLVSMLWRLLQEEFPLSFSLFGVPCIDIGIPRLGKKIGAAYFHPSDWSCRICCRVGCQQNQPATFASHDQCSFVFGREIRSEHSSAQRSHGPRNGKDEIMCICRWLDWCAHVEKRNSKWHLINPPTTHLPTEQGSSVSSRFNIIHQRQLLFRFQYGHKFREARTTAGPTSTFLYWKGNKSGGCRARKSKAIKTRGNADQIFPSQCHLPECGSTDFDVLSDLGYDR